MKDKVIAVLKIINKSAAQVRGDPRPNKVRRHRRLVMRQFANIAGILADHADTLGAAEFDELMAQSAVYLDAQQTGLVQLLHNLLVEGGNVVSAEQLQKAITPDPEPLVKTYSNVPTL